MELIGTEKQTELQHWQRLAESLRNCPDWGAEEGPIEIIRTHISVVLLGRRRVLKLKRPIDLEFLRSHELLQPFGNGNPQPLFFARAVEPVGELRVSNEKHLILRLRQGAMHRRAVYFDGATNEIPKPPWDVAFRIGADEYGGETLVGMRIEGLRAAEKP